MTARKPSRRGFPSLAEWMAMPPARAARVVAQRLGLDADRERKLRLIIESERKRRADVALKLKELETTAGKKFAGETSADAGN